MHPGPLFFACVIAADLLASLWVCCLLSAVAFHKKTGSRKQMALFDAAPGNRTAVSRFQARPLPS
jgi:hypothetical protein